MNTFGTLFRLTTFGESHGIGIGGVIDGMPAGIKFDLDYIQNEVNRRKGGKIFTTPRKEDDIVEIYSGVFENITTGTPIGFFIRNSNSKSRDYDNIKEIFRPGHADYTYWHKFGIRDHRGGGRSSARETLARVVGGAIANLMLKELGITVESGIFSVGDLNFSSYFYTDKSGKSYSLDDIDFLVDDDIKSATIADFDFANKSDIFALFNGLEDKFKAKILDTINKKDSIGGSVATRVCGICKGLGEVLYDKLDSKIAQAIMGINGVKSVEIGIGAYSSLIMGSQNNDLMDGNGFLSNKSGGILGGISNGSPIFFRTFFKPTPSIFKKQTTQDINQRAKSYILKGRHDPCIAIRGTTVVTAMTRLILADLLLLNIHSKFENIAKIYKD